MRNKGMNPEENTVKSCRHKFNKTELETLQQGPCEDCGCKGNETRERFTKVRNLPLGKGEERQGSPLRMGYESDLI